MFACLSFYDGLYSLIEEKDRRKSVFLKNLTLLSV